MKRSFSILLIFILLFLISGCGESRNAEQTRLMLDTVVTVRVSSTRNAAALVEEALALCQSYEAVFDRNDPDSEISKINASGGVPIEISADMAEVLSCALCYAAATDGIFDPTVAPLSDLWDFHAEQPAPPTKESLDAALPLVGYKNIILESGTVCLVGGATLDLGAAAKGYIADRMAALLKERGAKEAMINLGGNVYVLGKEIAVGVQDPSGETGQTAAVVRIGDCSAVTSGNYQRCFTYEGITYHHLLDTSTGYPFDSDTDSVTVICSDSLLADVLSTTVYLLGYEKGAEFLEYVSGAEGIFVGDYGVRVTSGLALEDGAYVLKNTAV